MYLSRLILNPRSRQVQRELADPYEMHRTICNAFPDANYKKNEPSGILFRMDSNPDTDVPTLLVQSLQEPSWFFLVADRKNYLLGEETLPPGVENPAWKKVTLQLSEGQMLGFRLRANPTVKKDREGKKQGRRLGLFREEDQLNWLKRKLESAGAMLISVHISNQQMARCKLFIERAEEKQIRFLSVQFDGVLKVKDPNRLIETIQAGIGSGKGLGFGLLSLARYHG